MYTIVDIETTGNGIKGNKITEISIFKYDGYEVVDEFTSLVNPECTIPYFITGLTGIDNDMVRDSPKLVEIADKILEITEETIFVAHSVAFDYNVIKNEFNSLGIDFVRKKLCTVRLSRKLIPGYNSYSLGKLCSSLNIPLTDRHRARGDALATTLLFQKLLRTEGAEDVFKTFLNARSQEKTLPPALPKHIYDGLPTTPGIYYFKNAKGKIIYIGKAINIKKRVLSHFYDKTSKEIRMCADTADIDHELSGSELVALLMESAAIKHHYPEYNRSQKRTVQRYGVFSYEDRNGVLHLAFNKIKSAPNPITVFYNTTDCRLYLEEICKTFSLCAKFCHLQENVTTCSHYRIPECQGICRGQESVEAYNKKVMKAISHMRDQSESYVILESGRTYNENAFVLVESGRYRGYGFVDKDIQITTLEDMENHLIPQKNTLESERIITSYITRNPQKPQAFDSTSKTHLF
ncbi:exonuclease domain-containing protein [Maribacter polysaccharolyticus]|uniref:exonuclease domain-containing protein n=1 Tax=Maribacter polysaccharolyticus TaxID=3020831 RepID=UPI00237F7CAB|nr:exonuclease domain-containing protein [Maribacter polysaccharolyticus]MDE3741648.1 exonuclease domain-containing protein [Maribacter polysaccharolyticus]